jgi:hypothetical protein
MLKSEYKHIILNKFMLSNDYNENDVKKEYRKIITLNGTSNLHVETYLTKITKDLGLKKEEYESRTFKDEKEHHYIYPVHTPLIINLLIKFYSFIMKKVLEYSGVSFEKLIHPSKQISFICFRKVKTNKPSLLVFGGIVGGITSMKLFCNIFPDRTIIMPLIPLTSDYGSSEMNISNYFDNIKTFLDKENIKEIDIFGWSYGGGIATKFMSRHDEFKYKKILLLEPILYALSGLTGVAWMREGYFKSLIDLCKKSKWYNIIRMIGFNHILHMNSLPMILTPMYRGAFDPFYWDKDNITFILSKDDPVTKDECTYIYSKFKNSKILLNSGTHGDAIRHTSKFSEYLT